MPILSKQYYWSMKCDKIWWEWIICQVRVLTSTLPWMCITKSSGSWTGDAGWRVHCGGRSRHYSCHLAKYFGFYFYYFKRHVRRFTIELDRNVAFEFLEALVTTLPLWWAVTLKLPQVTSPGLTPLEPPNAQGWSVGVRRQGHNDFHLPNITKDIGDVGVL